MRGFVIGTVVTAVAFYILVTLLPDMFAYDGGIPALIVISVIFGVVNGLIGPIVKTAALPISFVTMGLVGFLINAALLLLTAWLSDLARVPADGRRLPAGPADGRHAHRGRSSGRSCCPSSPPSSGLSSPTEPALEESLRAAARRFGTPLFVTDLATLDAACAGVRDGVSGSDRPAVLGQGERRAGRHRPGRGARVRRERRLARRVGARPPRRRAERPDHAGGRRQDAGRPA